MKQRLTILTLAVLLSSSSVSASPGRSHTPVNSAGSSEPIGATFGESAQAASCRKFVGEFYAWYLAHGKNTDPLRVALKRKTSNFSKELVRQLNEDYRAAEKSPNEIVGLDFDPVLNSQDFAEKYVAGKVASRGKRFVVEVFDVYAGKRSAVPAVFPELEKSGSRWVFTNFRYRHEGKSSDLLGILKQLRADRKKGG